MYPSELTVTWDSQHSDCEETEKLDWEHFWKIQAFSVPGSSWLRERWGQLCPHKNGSTTYGLSFGQRLQSQLSLFPGTVIIRKLFQLCMKGGMLILLFFSEHLRKLET